MNKPEPQELKDLRGRALTAFAEEAGFTPDYLAVVDHGNPGPVIEWALTCALRGGVRMTERALLAEQENAVLRARLEMPDAERKP